MTTLPELYTDGARILHTSRRRVSPIGGLGPRQLQWIAARGWLAGPRVTRMADHERAAAAYRIAGLIEDTRNAMKETV
jgi:hypothetical protein